MARGGTGASGINRALSGPEAFVMINASADGSTSGPHPLRPRLIPARHPRQHTSRLHLPDLNATSDVVSGIGAGVIVDGNGFATACFTVSGSGNVIEGLTSTQLPGRSRRLQAPTTSSAAALIAAQRNVINTNSSSGVYLWRRCDRQHHHRQLHRHQRRRHAALPNGTASASSTALRTTPSAAAPLPSATSSPATHRGVIISGAGTTGKPSSGNYIGTNAAGTAIVPDTARRVVIEGRRAEQHDRRQHAAERNVISGNGIGVVHRGRRHQRQHRQGNYIGTDAAGHCGRRQRLRASASAAGAQNNTIGGTSAGEGNVISGNNHAGMLFGEHRHQRQHCPRQLHRHQRRRHRRHAQQHGRAHGVTAAQNNLIGGSPPARATSSPSTRRRRGGERRRHHRNPIRGNSIYSNTAKGIDNNPAATLELAPPRHHRRRPVNGIACPLCTVDVYNDRATRAASTSAPPRRTAPALSPSGASHPLPNITAIAMDAAGNTSEFSAAFAAPDRQRRRRHPRLSDPCPTQPRTSTASRTATAAPTPTTTSTASATPARPPSPAPAPTPARSASTPPARSPAPPIDCRNIAEDIDAFKDTDGCPEPDNDNDGFPDVTDDCPGTDAQAGADGMLGSPQDLNHNGIQDERRGPPHHRRRSPHLRGLGRRARQRRLPRLPRRRLRRRRLHPDELRRRSSWAPTRSWPAPPPPPPTTSRPRRLARRLQRRPARRSTCFDLDYLKPVLFSTGPQPCPTLRPR